MSFDDLFTTDYEATAAEADSCFVMTGHGYGVVFYRNGTTLRLLSESAVPAFCDWLAGELAEGRWQDGGANPTHAGRHYDRVSKGSVTP